MWNQKVTAAQLNQSEHLKKTKLEALLKARVSLKLGKTFSLQKNNSVCKMYSYINWHLHQHTANTETSLHPLKIYFMEIYFMNARFK